MTLSAIDVSIIVLYLVAVASIGLIMKKRAEGNKDAYLLGGHTLPWYALGVSNASGMFDISGTMWMVMLAFVYGFKSIWIPWLWPSFNQVFLMMFLAAWLRRSNVTTGAEWMLTRFGKGKDVNKSHTVVVIFALLSCLGFLAYGFIGLGKFVEIFIPWSSVAPYIPFTVAPEYVPHFYGLIFTSFAVFYSILGGMSSIVWADVLQYIIMTIGAFVIGFMAMSSLETSTLNVPANWYTPFFGMELDLDWSGIIEDANAKIQADGYSFFGIFFMLMLFKGVLASLAGPTPNYDMQKILSTRSPQDAAKMSGFVSLVLIPTRYLMIIGFTVLALLNYDTLNLKGANGVTDFEQILPAAILNFAPVGIMGLILAGLLAAFIGTFAGTLNAAQAYLVNDIYLRYVNENPSSKQVTNMNYLTGVVVVLISVVLGFLASDVNTLLQWIVSGLYGGYIASNVLKWYWWRFNSSGFFWGMLSGITPALIFPLFYDGLALNYFPILLVLSLIGSIIGTLTAPPTPMETLKKFYRNVRPWGFWKPVDEAVKADDPTFRTNTSFWLDAFNVVVGVVGQMSLTLLPFYLVMSMFTELGVVLLILLVCGIILKKTWWDKLDENESHRRPEDKAPINQDPNQPAVPMKTA